MRGSSYAKIAMLSTNFLVPGCLVKVIQHVVHCNAMGPGKSFSVLFNNFTVFYLLLLDVPLSCDSYIFISQLGHRRICQTPDTVMDDTEKTSYRTAGGKNQILLTTKIPRILYPTPYRAPGMPNTVYRYCNEEITHRTV